jgi:hypothetical protein
MSDDADIIRRILDHDKPKRRASDQPGGGPGVLFQVKKPFRIEDADLVPGEVLEWEPTTLGPYEGGVAHIMRVLRGAIGPDIKRAIDDGALVPAKMAL